MSLFWVLTCAGFYFLTVPSTSTASDFSLPAEFLEDIESAPINHEGASRYRVKKGGAFDSRLLTLSSYSESESESDTNIQEKRRLKSRPHLHSNPPFISNKAKPQKIHRGKSRRPIHHQLNLHPIDNSLPQDENNRFYYFNEDLPATRIPQSYDPLVKLTHADPGEPRQNLLSKRNSNFMSNNQTNQSFWNPILVETINGPFHLHFPIMTHYLRSKIDVQDILEEATKYKNPLDFNFASIPLSDEGQTASRLLSRKRRGLGHWLKKVLHIGKKPTTPKPPPSTTSKSIAIPKSESTHNRKYDDDNYDDDAAIAGRDENREQEERKKVSYHPDQHGDTEIDWLLPKSLRKSSILARLHKSNGNNDPMLEEIDQLLRISKNSNGDTSPNTPQSPHPRRNKLGRRRNSNHRQSQNGNNWNGNSQEFPAISTHDTPKVTPAHGSSRKYLHLFENPGRRKPKSGDSFGMYNENPEYSESEHYSMEDAFLVDEEIGKPAIRRTKVSRQKRSLLEPEIKSQPAVSVNLNVNKEVHAKLPKYTFPPVPITKLSGSSGDQNEPISTASKEELRLLHELFIHIVNGKCPQKLETRFVEAFETNLFAVIDSTKWPTTTEETSSDMSTLIHQLVNCSLKGETEKDSLQMLLLQEKYSSYDHLQNEIEFGGPLYRSKRGRLGDSNKYTTQSDSPSTSGLQLSNFEFALISFISEECGYGVSRLLLYSAAQLILEALHENYRSPFVPFPEMMIDRNFNIVQNCANLIVKHRQGEQRLKRKLQEYLRKLPKAVSPSPSSYSYFKAPPPPLVREPAPIHATTTFTGINMNDDLVGRSRTERKRNTQPSLFFSSQNQGMQSIFHEFPVFDSGEWKYKK